MNQSENDKLWPYIQKVTDKYEELGFKLSFHITCLLAMREQELAEGPQPTE